MYDIGLGRCLRWLGFLEVFPRGPGVLGDSRGGAVEGEGGLGAFGGRATGSSGGGWHGAWELGFRGTFGVQMGRESYDVGVEDTGSM